MNYKKIILFSLMLLTLSLTAVSAVDLNDDFETLSSDDDDFLAESSEIGDSKILSASTGTFNDLQVEINNASAGSVLDLTMDYKGGKNSRVQLNKDLTIDGHGHTIDCLDKGGCSAFYSSSGNIVLKNLRIINGHNDNNNKGGAIYITGSAQYTLEDCTFENNWADDYGGAIYSDANKPLTVKNCVFKSNKADDHDGGAIYSKGVLNIENSKFVSNSAYVDGGAVYSGKELNIYNSRFESNNAKPQKDEEHGRGGAIYANGNLLIENSKFLKNQAHWGGGAIETTGVTHINGCLFDSNKAKGKKGKDIYGGAIRAHSDLYIDSSTFENNLADFHGGAIYGEKSIYINYNQNITQPFNSFFTGNKLDSENGDRGGTIFCKGKVYAKNAVFSSSKALVDGGAIYADDDVTVEHCLFEKNKVTGAAAQCHGGAIRSTEDVYIVNSTFKDNYAEDYGAAVFADNVYINVNQADSKEFTSFFINNEANDNDGGAIFSNDDVKAFNAVFSGNSADVDGGSIYSEDNIYVTNCLFENNKADGALIYECYGGAFRAEDNAVIDNCTFRNNYAENDGGAVYAKTVTLKNTSIFEGNTARDYGGAIYTKKFKEDVKYTIFIDNKAKKEDGGAIYIDDENSITFSQNVFVRNSCDDEGGAIYADSRKSHLTLKYNIFIDNKAGDTGDSVYSCGSYNGVFNNYWGGKNPTSKNDQVIEWMPLLVPNWHETDTDPLTMVIIMPGSAVVGEKVNAMYCFYKSNGCLCNAPIFKDVVTFNAGNATVTYEDETPYSLFIGITPQYEGTYVVSADLYGKSVSKTLQVSADVRITVPDIVAYHGGYQVLNIHLDGNLSSNQKVDVSFNSRHYVEFTDENGDASVLIDMLYVDPGRHDIIVNVYGINVTSAITIQSTIYGEDLYTVYGDESAFEVGFLDNQGQNLAAGKLISYQIDGERIKHTFMKNNDGIMAFDVSSFSPGEHSITVINEWTKENKTFEIVILPEQTNLLDESNNQSNDTVYDDIRQDATT